MIAQDVGSQDASSQPTEFQDGEPGDPDADSMASTVSAASLGSPAIDNDRLDLNLQLDWTAETLHRWNIDVEVIDTEANQSNTAAKITELRNLCSDPTTCGFLHRSEKAASWHFHSAVAMNSGAAAFRVQAAKTAEVVVTIHASTADAPLASDAGGSAASSSTAPAASPSVTRIPITQLLSDPHSSSTGADGPGWTLQRTKNDSLRVWIDAAKGVSPSGLICEPNVELPLYVRSHAAQVPNEGELRLHSTMIRVADHHVVATKTSPISLDSDGNSEPILFQHVAPDEAGVYEVRFELEQGQNPLWSRWRRHSPPLARVNHVFTVLPAATSLDGQVNFEAWPTVSKIKPSEGSQWTVPTFFNTRNNPLIPTSLIKQDHPRSNAIDAGQKITIVPGGKTFESSLAKLRPGHPHYVTVRYPANRAIHVRLELTSDAATNDAATEHTATQYVLLDEKRASDRYREDQNQWRSQSFLYYPHGNDQLRLTNLDLDQDAAIESIEIKVGPQDFAVRSPTPQATSQLSTPVARSRMSMLNIEDFDWPSRLAGDEAQRLAKSDFSAAAISLHQLFVATERLQAYASVLGVNSICISANEGGKTLFPTAEFLPTPASAMAADHKRQTQWLDLILSLMDRSDFQVVVGIDPTMTMRHVQLHAQPQHSPAPLSHYTLIDPVVQQALYAWIQELLQHTNRHSCFAGITIPCSASHHTAAFDCTVPPSDAVLRQFAIAVGKPDATISDVQHWIRQDKQASLQKWAIQSNRNFYTSVSHLLGSKLCLLTELSQTHLASDSGLSLVDMTWPAAHSNLVPMTSHKHEGWTTLAQQIEDQQNASHYVSLLQPITGRVGLDMTPHRFASAASAGASNETVPSSSPSPLSPATPSPTTVPPRSLPATIIDRSLAPHLSLLIDRIDPRVVMIDHLSVGGSFPQNLRPILLAYNAAPSRPMKEFGSPDQASQTVQVRWGMENQHLVLSLTNHAPWPCEVDVISKKAIRWKEVGQSTDVTRHSADMLMCTVPLNAGQWKVIRSEQPQSSDALSTWVSRVHGDNQTIDKIKSDVTIVVERLGMLADSEPYAVLSNPGFEVVGGIGITGWMHAQYPEGAVQIDENEAIEGQRSLCLTTANAMATKTWLVSETITPPKTGRLAVSLACRSAASEVTTPHRVRVSVEGTQSGASFRHSEEVDVPRNGTWQPRKVLVEADKIDPMTMDSLRITIDSLSPGKLWIDDVHLHDFFPMNKERAELQSQAFLAVQGLQRGNLAPSARLLKNRWAQFLLNDTRVRPTPVIKEDAEEVAAPTGVAERIKGWLPKPIRF
ncbi:hypothetical protein [Novipirellula caenicola]|uniref:hypothetical protein n=1 Tax=Novipirellula caenicola TaxID=1536901 RepID=UPI0031EED4D8